jgi:Na+/alanine symporter
MEEYFKCYQQRYLEPCADYSMPWRRIYFSVITRYCRCVFFAEMIRLLFRGTGVQKKGKFFSGVYPGIAGRVGTGNIAG